MRFSANHDLHAAPDHRGVFSFGLSGEACLPPSWPTASAVAVTRRIGRERRLSRDEYYCGAGLAAEDRRLIVRQWLRDKEQERDARQRISDWYVRMTFWIVDLRKSGRRNTRSWASMTRCAATVLSRQRPAADGERAVPFPGCRQLRQPQNRSDLPSIPPERHLSQCCRSWTRTNRRPFRFARAATAR